MLSLGLLSWMFSPVLAALCPRQGRCCPRDFSGLAERTGRTATVVVNEHFLFHGPSFKTAMKSAVAGFDLWAEHRGPTYGLGDAGWGKLRPMGWATIAAREVRPMG